jgi:hypothetical protein
MHLGLSPSSSFRGMAPGGRIEQASSSSIRNEEDPFCNDDPR